MDVFQKDFSDDSLMVDNDSIDPSPNTGPALTNSGLDDSPCTTLATRDQLTGRRNESPSPLVNLADSLTTETPLSPVSSQQTAPAPAPITTTMTTAPKLLAGQDGDDGTATSARPNGPILSEAEAYADNLAREIVNNSVSNSSDRRNSDAIGNSDNPTVGEAAASSGAAAEEEEKEEEAEIVAPSEADTSTGNRDEETHYEEYKSVLKETESIEDDEEHHDNREEADSSSSPLKVTKQEEQEEAEAELQREDLISVDTPAKPEALASTMEFAKNYSDDLLMGQNDGNGQGQGESHTTNADLADFELPPYSGSSSGSSAGNIDPLATSSSLRHQQSSSPTRRDSGNGGKKAQSQPSTSTSQVGSSSSPSLTALRDLLKTNYSRVSHVFLWRKPIESGVCFGIGVSLIIALTFFSIISVVAYSTLGLMLASGSIRLYKTVMKTLNRSTDTPVDHIWNKVQALNVSMSHEKMHELVDSSLGNLNASLVYFKQVLLVEDKMATIKFGAFVYLLTYIGAWFNGMTLITIGFLGLFSVPILYEKNNTKIDEYLNLATGHLSSATSMITNKVGSLVSGSTAATGADKKQD